MGKHERQQIEEAEKIIFAPAKTVELAPRMKQVRKRTFRQDTAQFTAR